MGRKATHFNYLKSELADNSGLSPRRAMVLELLARGMTTREVAEHMGISEDGVSAHIDQLRSQFGAQNRTDLICQAWAHGVLKAGNSASYSRTGVNVRPASELEKHFHRAQARLENRTHCCGRLAQKDVGLLFYVPATGEGYIYDVPAYLRKRINNQDHQAVGRIVAYSNRVRALVRDMDYAAHKQQQGVQAALSADTKPSDACVRANDGHHGAGEAVRKAFG